MSTEEKSHQDNSNNPSEKIKENPKKSPTLEFSFLGGLVLGLIIIFVNLGALFTLLLFFNFLLDSKKYNFDKIGLTRLGKNKHFSLCGAFSCVDNWYYSFGANLAILLVLYFQEIVITSKWMKETFVKRALGDLFFYPKYLLRLFALFNICMSIMLYQPMNFEDFEIYPKLNLSEYFHPAFLFIPFIMGGYLIFSSLYYNLYLNDELGICLFIKILRGVPVKIEGDYLWGYGIYRRVRSPFRAGAMLIFFSLSPKWDLGRALYTIIFCFAMYIEGINDDRYYFEKYEEYRKYMKEVPCRFYDLSFITGKKKRINNEDQENVNNNNKNNKDEDDNKNKRRRNNKKKQE